MNLSFCTMSNIFDRLLERVAPARGQAGLGTVTVVVLPGARQAAACSVCALCRAGKPRIRGSDRRTRNPAQARDPGRRPGPRAGHCRDGIGTRHACDDRHSAQAACPGAQPGPVTGQARVGQARRAVTMLRPPRRPPGCCCRSGSLPAAAICKLARVLYNKVYNIVNHENYCEI